MNFTEIMDNQEEILHNKSFDMGYDVLDKIEILIFAKCDSDTIKSEIEGLMIQYDTIRFDLGKIYGENKK